MKELKKTYKKNFGNYKIPKTLKKLMAFEEEYGAEEYSESFYLCSDSYKDPDMGQYSLDDEYFERLIEFANADGTGAKYCFWVNETGIELENAPIVVIGSEGHIQIIAKNLKELLQLLSFGPETMDGQFYRDNEWFEDMEHADTFRKWMNKKLDIKPIKDFMVADSEEVNKIVKNAVESYAEPFKNWMMSLKPQYSPFEDYD